MAFFLPDQAGDVVSLRHTTTEETKFEPLKPKIDTTKKVVRYYSGKAPTWIEGDEKGIESNETSVERSDHNRQEVSNDNNTNRAKVDSRLSRLSKMDNNSMDKDNAPRARRRIYEAEVVIEDVNTNQDTEDIEYNRGSQAISYKLNEEDDDGVDEIRSRRAHALQKLAEREKQQLNAESSASAESRSSGRVIATPQIITTGGGASGAKVGVKKEESESEYETDTDDDDDYSDEEDNQQLLKPVFVPKRLRETILTEEKIKEEEAQKAAKAQLKLDERKKQTKLIVADSIRRKEEQEAMLAAATDGDSDAGLPDDADDEDDELEVRSTTTLFILLRIICPPFILYVLLSHEVLTPVFVFFSFKIGKFEKCLA